MDFGMFALLRHASVTVENERHAVEQDTAPLALQRGPTAFHRIVFAVRWRVENQVDRQPRPVGELDHSIEILRPPTVVVRPVFEVDHQTSDVTKAARDMSSPQLDRVDPRVARLSHSEDQNEPAGDLHKEAERIESHFQQRVMVPRLDGFSIGAVPCFPPRE